MNQVTRDIKDAFLWRGFYCFTAELSGMTKAAKNIVSLEMNLAEWWICTVKARGKISYTKIHEIRV